MYLKSGNNNTIVLYQVFQFLELLFVLMFGYRILGNASALWCLEVWINDSPFVRRFLSQIYAKK